MKKRILNSIKIFLPVFFTMAAICFSRGQDEAALSVRMWTNPGGGYFYSSQGSHVASIILRHLTGMELQAYIGEKLAEPMGFGGWGYETVWPVLGVAKLPHTFGGGGIALRSTDALRFAYLLLHQGRALGVDRCSAFPDTLTPKLVRQQELHDTALPLWRELACAGLPPAIHKAVQSAINNHDNGLPPRTGHFKRGVKRWLYAVRNAGRAFVSPIDRS